MNRVLFLAVALFFAAIPVTGSQAATKCYWSMCDKGCPSPDKAMTKKWQPVSRKGSSTQCIKTWCCSPKDAKTIEKDDGMACRIKCGNKGSAYGGYFQCMDKCLGRKR